MAENNSLVPLAKVATEVEESQTKLHLFNVCIKAQQELAHKLQKEAERRKEICNFTRNSNHQLEAEIRNAGQEINSLQISLSSIKSANIQLRKELLISKQQHLDMIEHMRKGEKKYEELWIQSKNRYESIPFVQKWLETIKKTETQRKSIAALENEAQLIHDAIKVKKLENMQSDKENIVKLAEFLCRQRPYLINVYKEVSSKIVKLNKQIHIAIKQNEVQNRTLGLDLSIDKLNLRSNENTEISKKVESETSDLDKSDDSLMMPKLQLSNSGLDLLNVKLQINKIGSHKSDLLKRSDYESDLEKNIHKRPKDDDNFENNYMSSYFNKPMTAMKDSAVDLLHDNTLNIYSQRKLINILEDVKIDKQEAYDMVSRANPIKLIEINDFAASVPEDGSRSTNNKKVTMPISSDVIEEIDLTESRSQNLLIPPTQYKDLSQSQQDRSYRHSQQALEVVVQMSTEDAKQIHSQSQSTSVFFKNSQEAKKVSFDIPMTIQEDNEVNMEDPDESCVDETNQTISELGDTSMVTDDNYNKIKELILKKNNLDLTPQFVYAKNSVLQKKNDDNLTTSIFFQQIKNKETKEDQPLQEENNPKVTDLINSPIVNLKVMVDNDAVVDTDNAASSPKSQVLEIAKPVTGLLYNHGPQGLPESLDVSMSTTGFEETDGDFPHCLDSSLLLSPKADVPPPCDLLENKASSQEVPNFLSGFRKTGLLFFGQQPEAGPSANTVSQENNFSFNFGGQDKKTKGGLFSFFR